MCDEDNSGGLTKAEAHKCIDANAPDDMKAEAHAMVDAGFEHADKNGDGELTKKELRAAMGPPSLAQDGPSAGQIIDMCDADSSGGLTKAEAHKCIDDNAPEEMKK